MIKNQIFRFLGILLTLVFVLATLFIMGSLLKKSTTVAHEKSSIDVKHANTFHLKTEKFDFYDSIQSRHSELKNKYLPNEKDIANGKLLHVQVGAFKTAALAEEAEMNIKKINKKYVTQILLNKDFFTVQIVNLTSRAEAETTQKALQRKGFKDAFIKK